jgi:ArsR family transcriptional regulator, arsenate/arsenite/antimonite-responsive transcriptional repressor
MGLSAIQYFDYSSFMETNDAIAALTALGHAKRLAIFRLLVVAGPLGRMAGDIGDELGMPGATLSFHLKELANAGLITAEPQGRFVCYRAAFDAMNGLIAYLTYNCCAGSTGAACTPGSATCQPGDGC